MKTRKNVKNKPLALSLQTIASLIGEEKTLRLSKHTKHRHVYIKKRFSPDDKLVRIIGRPALYILHENFAGELIHITPKDGYSAEAVRLLRQGLSIESIARRFNVAPARIATIAKSRRVKPGQGRGVVGSSGGAGCGGKGCPSVPPVSEKI